MPHSVQHIICRLSQPFHYALIVFLMLGVRAEAQPMIEEIWEGRIIEAGGAYRLKLEFTSVDGEICHGLATSINETFF